MTNYAVLKPIENSFNNSDYLLTLELLSHSDSTLEPLLLVTERARVLGGATTEENINE